MVAEIEFQPGFVKGTNSGRPWNARLKQRGAGLSPPRVPAEYGALRQINKAAMVLTRPWSDARLICGQS
ncbi:hypothetical protein FHU14_000225 [Mesorhizobium sp. RMAD-H1]|nr:hypothetical protein [Mesorhizobium sp. RMAD-H1]